MASLAVFAQAVLQDLDLDPATAIALAYNTIAFLVRKASLAY
jgi:hypothetical protein